jgi:hypothetical protein
MAKDLKQVHDRKQMIIYLEELARTEIGKLKDDINDLPNRGQNQEWVDYYTKDGNLKIQKFQQAVDSLQKLKNNDEKLGVTIFQVSQGSAPAKGNQAYFACSQFQLAVFNSVSNGNAEEFLSLANGRTNDFVWEFTMQDTPIKEYYKILASF